MPPRAAREIARTNATWTDPREDGLLPDVYLAMGQTAENVATLARHLAPAPGRVGRHEPEPRREGHRRRVLRARDPARDDARRHRGLRRRRPPRRGHPRGRAGAQPRLPRERHDHRRQLLPPQRRRRRGVVVMSDTRARDLGPHAARAHRLHRGVGALPRGHGPRPGRGVEAGPRPRGHDHRRHGPLRDQRGLRRAGAAQRRRPRHGPRQAQRPRRRHRSRPPVRLDRARGS